MTSSNYILRMVLALDKWFWWHEYWFPPGITWEDIKESGSISYPKPRDLLYVVPYALLLVGVQYLFQRFIALPLGRQLGVRDKVRLNAPPNTVLETFYATHSKKPKEGQLICLSKQCDLPTIKVERWFRYRRNQDKPSLTTKFCSVSWSSLCYLISFCTGLVVLYDKPWLWDPRECWVGYPQQPLQRSVYWYYMMELSFALSLTFTMAFDVKRKDFKEQIVHHATTIILISYSYCANYLRIGSLVMLLHVSSTFLLELTKLLHYLNWRSASDLLFLTFSFVFLVTRLIIFPCRVLYTSLYSSMEQYQPFFGYYFMNALLMVLQLLHVFWASLIIHMLYKFINGTLKDDARSDTEESDESEEEQEQKKKETTRFSNVTNNCSQSNGYCSETSQSNVAQQLTGRAHLTNGCADAPEVLTAPVHNKAAQWP
ncbi:ceramide synthase 4-like [Mauremys reevesii]|uniref:ceramide synthase 4-like n=1 Tax=Mauremys reevesii TaxID=260615 RepID=UPI00193FE995|nr:ceramide synthase 4-like [Mauremys reevesii]